MEITFTLTQIVTIAAGLSAIVAAIKLVYKPFKVLSDRFEKYDKLLANDKQHLDKLDKVLTEIRDDITVQGDMTYQMLNHMATNNNTGGMARCLDEYNAHYRHNSSKEE